MKNLLKEKTVYVKVFAGNGHFVETKIFGNELEAKNFLEETARARVLAGKRDYFFQVSDVHNNDLYEGNGWKYTKYHH